MEGGDPIEATADPVHTRRRRWPIALPALAGRRRFVAATVYLLLAACTLCVIVGTLWALGVDSLFNAPAASRFGFRTATTEGGIAIAGASPETRASGLHADDAIVAIGSFRLPADATEFTVARQLASERAATVTLTLRSPGAPERAVLLRARSGVWWRLDPFSHLPLWLYAMVVMLGQPAPILFVASLLLFIRRPRDPEAMLFAFAFLLLNFTPDLLWWMDGFGISSAALGHLSTLGWLATFVAMAGFPDGRFTTRWASATVLAAILVELATLGIRAWFGGTMPVGGKAIVGAAVVMVGLAAGGAVMLRYRAMLPGPERQQIKWAVGGFTVSALFLLIVGPFDPATFLLSGNPFLFLLGQLGGMLMTAGFALGLLVSLLRYRLYDAEAALARSIAYGALTISLVGIFAASEKVIELVGERALGARLGAIAGVVGTALAAVLIGPLHHRVNHWAEHRFQRMLIRLRHDLPALMDDLRETETLETLGATVAERVGEGVRARHVAVLAGSSVIGARNLDAAAILGWWPGWTPPASTTLDCDPSDELFPVRVALAAGAGGPAGWLLLGPRPDDSLYGKAERAALVDVAEPIARAIQTVRRRDERDREQEQRIRSLETRLATAINALATAAPGPRPESA